GLEGAVVAGALDVLEELVDAALPLQHRVVVFLGADEVGEGELLLGEVELEGVAEGDLEGVVLAAGAAFEEEHAPVGADEELGGLAGAAGELLDLVEGADVVVGEDDGELVGGESGPAACAGGGEPDGGAGGSA